jgi:hypothetical protein
LCSFHPTLIQALANINLTDLTTHPKRNGFPSLRNICSFNAKQ